MLVGCWIILLLASVLAASLIPSLLLDLWGFFYSSSYGAIINIVAKINNIVNKCLKKWKWLHHTPKISQPFEAHNQGAGGTMFFSQSEVKNREEENKAPIIIWQMVIQIVCIQIDHYVASLCVSYPTRCVCIMSAWVILYTRPHKTKVWVIDMHHRMWRILGVEVMYNKDNVCKAHVFIWSLWTPHSKWEK